MADHLEAEEAVILDPEVEISEGPFANAQMNQLLEALRLPEKSRVPPTWKPPKPAFVKAAEAEEARVTEEPPAAEATTEQPNAGPSANAAENYHTAYGTARQWTRNVDRVMSGFCQWLNGAEKRQPYSIVGPNGECDSEDFIFLQTAIGDYMKTLNVNLDPKAAAIMAIVVIWIGHIFDGFMFRGRQLWDWWQKHRAEKKAEQKAAAEKAQRQAERRELVSMLANAVQTNELTAEEAAAQVADLFQESEVVEVEAEETYEDPNFKPRPTAPDSIGIEELRFRKANRFCLLPGCGNKVPERNGVFCSGDHRNQYFKEQSQFNLPKTKDI